MWGQQEFPLLRGVVGVHLVQDLIHEVPGSILDRDFHKQRGERIEDVGELQPRRGLLSRNADAVMTGGSGCVCITIILDSGAASPSRCGCRRERLRLLLLPLRAQLLGVYAPHLHSLLQRKIALLLVTGGAHSGLIRAAVSAVAGAACGGLGDGGGAADPAYDLSHLHQERMRRYVQRRRCGCSFATVNGIGWGGMG